MPDRVGPSQDEWRKKWAYVAATLKSSGKSTHAEDGDMIDNILREFDEARQRDLTRVEPVPVIANELGYSPSHLYALVRDGVLINMGNEGDIRLRVADVMDYRVGPGQLVNSRSDNQPGKRRSTKRASSSIKIKINS